MTEIQVSRRIDVPPDPARAWVFRYAFGKGRMPPPSDEHAWRVDAQGMGADTLTIESIPLNNIGDCWMRMQLAVDRGITMEIEGRFIEADLVIQFNPNNGGSRMRATGTVRATGPAWVIGPVLENRASEAIESAIEGALDEMHRAWTSVAAERPELRFP